MRGRYIVLEGGNGAGLTTQARLLIEKLAESNIEAAYFEEPGSTPFAAELKKLIRQGPSRTAKANVLAFSAARAETAAEIEATLDSGRWVIADRGYLSTIAFQGYGEGEDVEKIRQASEYALGQLRADLIIVLEVSPETAAIRQAGRAEPTDYFEAMASQFHDRVREGFRREAKKADIPIIDANLDESKVAEQIWKLVSPLITNPDLSYPKPVHHVRQTDMVATTKEASFVANDLSTLAYSELARLGARLVSDHPNKPEDALPLYVPTGLSQAAKDRFIKVNQAILKAHGAITRTLTNYAMQISEVPRAEQGDSWRVKCRKDAEESARPLLPVALSRSTTISLPTDKQDDIITQLRQSSIEELQIIGRQLLGKAEPAEVTHPIDDDYLGDLPAHSLDLEPVKLIKASPRNELDSLVEILYPYSELASHELRLEITHWTIDRKIDHYQQYLEKYHRAPATYSQVLQDTHYQWEMLTDFATYLDWQAAVALPPASAIQALTPRYGFDVPQIVDDAGLTDLFEKCFDLSFDLFNELEAQGYRSEAQYATLSGHRRRWQVDHSALQAFQFYGDSTQYSAACQQLVNEMCQKLAEVHPILAESLTTI